MQPSVTKLQRLAEVCFLFVLALLVLVPASPFIQRLTSWDSGVFLYIGWQMGSGALPYRDLWDHKPPLIFVIDMVGLALGGGSRWGVWALELVSLTAAVWFLFDLLRRAVGTLAAWYGVLAFLVSAFVTMDGGNYTTEYALLPQCVMLWVIATAPHDYFSKRRAFVLGLLSGLLFWLKQNDIAIPLALGLYVLFQWVFTAQKRAVLESFGALAGGALLVTVAVIAPFVLQGALVEFWRAAFLYNFVYIEETWLDRFLVLRYAPIFLQSMGLTVFAAIGWLSAAFTLAQRVLQSRRAVLERWGETFGFLGAPGDKDAFALTRTQLLRLVLVVLIALPLELFFVSLAGNSFDHYFLALLPVFAVFGSLTFRLLVTFLERAGLGQRMLRLFTVGLLLVLLSFASEAVRQIYGRISGRNHDAVIEYMQQHTQPEDTVLIWGGETRLSFAARRRTPTRFIYLRPITRQGVATVPMVLEFYAELATEPPRLIIDVNGPNRPLFTFPVQSEKLDAAAQALRSEYVEAATIEGWTVYERRTP